MKKTTFLLYFLFSLSTIRAQWNFQHSYGGNRNERCQSAFSTRDQGFLLNGATTSYGAGDVDALLIKTDAQGNTLWAKTSGTSGDDIPSFALETFDNKFIFIGSTYLTAGGTSSDAWLFKTDSAGNFLWAKTFGGINNESATEVVELADHGYAFVGTTNSYGSGAEDICFVRTDVNGDTLFTRIYGTPDNERGISLASTTDGGFVICGKSSSTINGSLVFQALVMRIDSTGDLLWTKLFGDTLFQEAQSVATTADGGFIVCGSRDFTSVGNYDILLFKTDSAGNLQWSKTYGGILGDASYAVLVNSDGTFVLSGYTNSLGYGHPLRLSHDNSFFPPPGQRNVFTPANHFLGNDSTNIFLMKTDSGGDTIWTRTYGDSLLDEAFICQKAYDGGYIISGYSDYHTADSSQMLVIKTDSFGFSGCYGLTSHPVVENDSLPEMNAVYSQTSGMTVATISLTTTNRLIPDSTYCLVTTAGKSPFLSDLRVYPNPARDRVTVTGFAVDEKKGAVSTPERLTVFDVSGSVIPIPLLINRQENSLEINVSTLRPGYYFLEIYSVHGRIVQGFIKE